jgi:hypothetical protein
MIPHREFRALDAWRELSREKGPRELGVLLRIVVSRGGVRETTDPLRDAACLESAALDDYRSALLADRGRPDGDGHRAAVLLRSCDELLGQAAELVACSVAQGHGRMIPAALRAPSVSPTREALPSSAAPAPAPPYIAPRGGRQRFSSSAWSRAVESARTEAGKC